MDARDTDVVEDTASKALQVLGLELELSLLFRFADGSGGSDE